MQLPQNVMQVGFIDEYYRLYLEDYVYTYIKQIEDTDDLEKKKIYLFGKREFRQDEILLYVYGAADNRKGVLTVHHEFFRDYEILGSLSFDDNEKVLTLQNGNVIPIHGFFVFYEQNPSMQTFLISIYQERMKQKEQEKQEKQQLEQRLKQYEQKEKENAAYFTKSIIVKVALSGLYGFAILICIVAITTINRYDKLVGFKERILQTENPDIITVNQTEINPYEEITKEDEPDTTFYIEERKIEAKDEKKEKIETWGQMEESNEEQSSMNVEETLEENKDDTTVNKNVEYIVKQGDSLSEICRNYYGNTNNMKKVCVLNDIENPNTIKQGQKILLP